MKNQNRISERGSTIIEFAIVVPFLTLAFFGTVGLGMMMGRYVQAVTVARDVAHMFSDGVDFSKTLSRNIVIQQLALGTGITDAGGNGVIILSKVMTVYQIDCDGAKLSASCNNLGRPVFIQRVTIGDKTLRASTFGTPSSAILDGQGTITPNNYMRNDDSSVRTAGFEAALDDAVQRATGIAAVPPAQAQGDSAYVVEVYFKYPDIGFLGWSTAGGAYAMFIFH